MLLGPFPALRGPPGSAFGVIFCVLGPLFGAFGALLASVWLSGSRRGSLSGPFWCLWCLWGAISTPWWICHASLSTCKYWGKDKGRTALFWVSALIFSSVFMALAGQGLGANGSPRVANWAPFWTPVIDRATLVAGLGASGHLVCLSGCLWHLDFLLKLPWLFP